MFTITPPGRPVSTGIPKEAALKKGQGTTRVKCNACGLGFPHIIPTPPQTPSTVLMRSDIMLVAFVARYAGGSWQPCRWMPPRCWNSWPLLLLPTSYLSPRLPMQVSRCNVKQQCCRFSQRSTRVLEYEVFWQILTYHGRFGQIGTPDCGLCMFWFCAGIFSDVGSDIQKLFLHVVSFCNVYYRGSKHTL